MHSLLKRQLKRHFGDQVVIPAEWRAFLDGVDEAYRASDTDRAMLERSLELSSQEMLDANSEMRAVFQAIPDLVFRLNPQGVILDVKAGAAGELMIARQDLIGKRIQDTPLQEVAQQFAEAVERVTAKNAPVIIEYSAVLQDQESNYEARLVPLPDRQIVVIIRNITERKMSLRLLGAAVEQSTEAIVITDAELDQPGPRILFVNPAFTRMTGYLAAEVLGQTPRILQGPKSDRDVLRRLRENLDRGETFMGETVNYRKDGTEFNIEWQVTPIRNSSGKTTHFVGIQRDITGRKRAETALRDSEARYRALFDGSADGIVIADTETKQFKYANPALCRMLGYTEAELRALGVAGIHPPESLPHVVAEFEAQARGDKTLAAGLPCLRKDGSVFHADINAVKITIDGRPCNVGFLRDITERKQAEEALRSSEERFRIVAETANDVIYEWDLKQSVEWRGKIDEMLGYGPGEFPRTLDGWAAAVHPEDQDRTMAALQAHLEGRAPYAIEYRVRRKDGVYRWWSARGAAVRTPDGKPTRMIGSVTDFTGRKQAEEAQQAGEKRLRALNVLQSLLLHPNPLEHKLQLVTEAVVQIVGADFARVWMIAPGDRCAAGCVHAQVTEGPHVCRFRDRCLHLLASSGRYTHTDGGHGRVPFGCYKIGQIAAGEEPKFLTNDVTNDPRVHNHAWAKELGLVAFAGYRLLDSEGKSLGVLALFSQRAISAEEDLLLEGIAYATSQVLRSAQAEEALRQSEERFRQFADQSSEVIWFTEFNPERILFVNRMVETVWGVPPERFYESARVWVNAIHPEDRPRVHEAWEACLQSRAPRYEAEYRVVRPDGTIRWVLDGGMPMRNAAGEIIRLSGVARDITERKQAENALLMFQFASDHAADTIFWLDQNAGFYYVNDEACRSLGYTREELMRLSLFDIDPFFSREQWEDDWKRFRDKPAETIRFESRQRRKDGSVFPIEVMVKYSCFGGTELHLAFVRDMTERKQAENALRMFQLASDNAADSIFWVDQNAGLYYVNDAACRSLGYPREELMRLNLFDIDPFISREQLEANWQRCRDEKLDVLRMESRHQRKDGSSFPIEVIAKHFDFDGTDLTLAFVRDMTEHKRTEAELTYERDLLRTLLDQSPDKIYFKDTQSRFIKAGMAHARLFGVASPEELLGRTDFDFFTEEHARPAFEDEQEIIRTGVPIIGKVEKEVWQDGRAETWCLTTKMPFRDQDGKIIGTFGVSKDITALKQVEHALTYERDLFQMLMNQSPDSIYFKDLQSRFLRFSQAKVKKGLAAELARHTAAHPNENPPAHLASEERFAEYLVGKTDFDLFAEEHARPAFEDEQEIIRTGVPLIGKVEKEVWLDGRETWVFTSKMPFRDKDGKITGTFGVSKDITAMKEAEAKLAREQARFRFVFENMPVGAALAHYYPDGRFERIINDAHLRICGLTREQDQLPGIYKQITHPEDAARQTEFFRELDDNRSGSLSMEKRYVRLDGKTVWVTYFLQRQQNPDGGFDRLTMVVDITELKQAEEQLRQLSQAVEQSSASIVITDPAGSITYVNPKFSALTGYTLAEALGKNPRILKSGETPAAAYAQLWQTITSGKEWHGEFHNKKKNGELYWELASISPIHDDAGRITHFLAVKEDITGRKRMEEQLFQSQKMETVGKLAGGVAHEFNSILTAIIIQSELLIEDLPPGDPLAKNAAEILKAANRAATLTRQLLAYGRKQILRPEALDLNHVLASMDGMLRHLMGGETVDVNIIPAANLHLVKADAGQIEQVIMNIALNARDAMSHGGRLTLETANVTFEPESVGRSPELKPGDYVLLAITDTGQGMSEEVKARMFEPFFTTKDIGQGPGLGLATSYGIIKQSGGHISVYSEPGRGTTFKIYLPQVEAQVKIPAPRQDLPDLPRGMETILLVEDDPSLREMAATLLRRLGYTVLVAANGVEAMTLKQQPDTGHVDLLFTDVVMPHMSGKELADRVRALYPHTKILFTSAYTENAIVHQGVLDKGVALLQKPFTPSALAQKVREVLDQPGT